MNTDALSKYVLGPTIKIVMTIEMLRLLQRRIGLAPICDQEELEAIGDFQLCAEDAIARRTATPEDKGFHRFCM